MISDSLRGAKETRAEEQQREEGGLENLAPAPSFDSSATFHVFPACSPLCIADCQCICTQSVLSLVMLLCSTCWVTAQGRPSCTFPFTLPCHRFILENLEHMVEWRLLTKSYLDQGDGKVGKSASCTSMRTWVRIPYTYITS